MTLDSEHHLEILGTSTSKYNMVLYTSKTGGWPLRDVVHNVFQNTYPYTATPKPNAQLTLHANNDLIIGLDTFHNIV
jgi:hypothetical protein